MAAEEPEVQIFEPTITEALDAYLADEQRRLKPRTYTRYADVVALLKDSLNSYGPNVVDPDELDRFQAAGFDIEGEAPPFCEVFGPAYIPDHLPEFLGHFLQRKVAAGADFLSTAGTVTRKLSRWLAEQGYIAPDTAEEAAETGAEAGRDLPAARRLTERLDAMTQGMPVSDTDIEGYFEVTRVEPGRLSLIDFLDGMDYGAITVPNEVTEICKVGWQIAGALGRHRGGYRLVEVFNVYT